MKFPREINLEKINSHNIVIYQTDYASVSFNLNDFEQLIEKKLIKNPSNRKYKILLLEIRRLASYSNHVLIEMVHKLSENSAEFVIADLLESGKCRIYLKEEKKYIEKIIIERCGYFNHPLAAAGGRVFKNPIDNKIIFKVEDWIA